MEHSLSRKVSSRRKGSEKDVGESRCFQDRYDGILLAADSNEGAHIGLPGRAGRRSKDRLKKAVVNY